MTTPGSQALRENGSTSPRSLLAAVAMLAWLGLLAGVLVAREPATAQLEGVAVARETGQPIPRARIAAHGEGWRWQREVKADARGRFRLEGIGTGITYISGSTNIHKSLKDEKIEVQEGPNNRITLTLDPVPPYLTLQTHQHVLAARREGGARHAKGSRGPTRCGSRCAACRCSTLLSAGGTATPGDDGLTVPRGTGDLVLAKELPTTPREPGGAALPQADRCAQSSPGLYSVWVHTRDASAGTVLSVSRLGVITKTSGKALLAYAVDLETDRPVPGARAALYRGTRVVAEGSLMRAGCIACGSGDRRTERSRPPWVRRALPTATREMPTRAPPRGRAPLTRARPTAARLA